MGNPKISAVIPVRDMAQYLDEVLTSWTGQTLRDIEILCIDDASTDHTPDLLREWAGRDPRIRVHRFDTNVSPWTARKWGIEHASGEYLLFADADDTIAPCACEELYAEMRRKPVDILHFDVNVINVNHLPEDSINRLQRFFTPYAGELFGDDIFTGCFEKKLYQFSLCNKLFSTELCKRSVAGTKEWFLPKAEDKALYWMIALNAKSYRGLPGKTYYNYYFGRGGSGHRNLPLSQFPLFCAMSDTANVMHEYLVSKGLCRRYQSVDAQNHQALLSDCLVKFRNEVADGDKGEAFGLMLQKWDASEVIGAIARYEWNAKYKVARYLRRTAALKSAPKKAKVIGTFYPSCANGGAERVMCDLCQLFASMGYSVVVFTDDPPSEIDYPLPEGAKRVVLPHHKQVTASTYTVRAQALEQALRDNQVDIMLYHAWLVNTMLWDALVCKANHVTFFAHCHGIFSYPLYRAYKNVHEMIAPYLLADGIVTLSKTDQLFWKHFNNNVHVTINPFLEGCRNWKTSDKLDEKQILWVGRLARQKQPEDALEIMREVIKEVPDAHLHMVGSGPNETYMEEFREKINSMGLTDHITMHGFQSKVREYYQRASIFLLTSQFEGYSLVLQESKLAGLPCVMYELPYLTLCEGNRGIIPVEANNTQAAAAAIIELLSDRQKRHRYARDARAHVDELLEFDFAGKWTEIFSSADAPHKDTVSQFSHIMVETLLLHYETGIEETRKREVLNAELRKREALDAELRRRENENISKRIARKLVSALRVYIDYGFLFTVKFAFSRLGDRFFRK